MGTCLALLLDPGCASRPKRDAEQSRLGTSWRPATSAISGSRPPSRSFRSRCRPTRRTLTPTTCLNHRPPAGHDYLAQLETASCSRARTRISSRRGSGEVQGSVKTCAKPSSCGPSSPRHGTTSRWPSSSCNRGCGDRGSPECAQGCRLCHARVGARQPGVGLLSEEGRPECVEGVARGSQPRTGFLRGPLPSCQGLPGPWRTRPAMDALAPVVSDVKRCLFRRHNFWAGCLTNARGSWRRHGNYFSVVSTWPRAVVSRMSAGATHR